jgi:hypothetical protein
MRRFLFRAAFAAATVIVTATAFSQDAPKPKPADAQNSYEPRSTTGAGQVLLAQFAGDWDVVKTFYPSSGGAPVQTKGECRQVMVQDGHFLQSDFTFFERDGKKSTGVGISGFDGKPNRFTTVGTTRGRRPSPSARATAPLTARRSSSTPPRSIPTARVVAPWRVRTSKRTAASSCIAISSSRKAARSG